ncbi:MAG: MotA/TolQ/ExbB proton channel family protein [Methylococcales bacterium]|jgi:biopolymer transport protein ExbB|nr:MotA/TolQ/ExbB proton channel family protein [Methylococcales bacterium]MBT7444199.1 MotA/TolQ/ExbB proton channel family protein [Methylococcales bacterium]
MESTLNMLQSGGILVYPLAAMLVASIIIIILKARALRECKVINTLVVDKIERILLEGNIPEATAFCKQNSLPMADVILAGLLNHHKSEAELKEVLEEVGRQQIPKIRRYLTLLGTIASVAPLMGLFGTVLGMIAVFASLGENISVDANLLANGISEALVTTAIGMVIAMLSLTFYNHFTAKVNNFIIEMERISLHMVAVLKRLH